jgi:hypothetical protein
LGIVDPAYGFDGTLAQFAPKSPLTRSPLLVFLDGDHDYDAVIADLRAVYAMKNRPHAIALHDFHLRSHRLKNTGVDRAVFDAFGEDVAYQRIGVQWGAEPVPGIDCPTESGCYWQPNGTEGALILLENYPELRV